MRFLTARRRRRHRSLAGQLFAMQVIVVAFVVTGGAALAYLKAGRSTADSARRQVTAVAAGIADAPTTVQAVTGADPSRVLQPYAERVRRDTGVEFVTIMDTNGIRYTHPNSAMIGKRFLGHTERALAGRTFTETFTGTLGPSVRVVAPVFGPQHRVIALVSVGITVRTLSAQVRTQLVPLIGVALLALAVGGVFTYLANARLRRHTHGMSTVELSRMYEYHDAILHTVREGLLLLTPDRRVVLANDGARELLRLPADVEGRQVTGLGLPEALAATLSGDGPCTDEIHLTRERVVVVNKSAVTSGYRDLGSVVTLRDHTELQALSGELDSVRGFTESLRSQTHEAANRLHTVVSLIELGRTDEAVEFATAELEIAQQLTDEVVEAVAEPVLAALLLGKAAQANERGVELVITADTRFDDDVLPGGLGQRELVTILGNLIDNAIDAAAEREDHPPMVFVTARTGTDELVLRVADTGVGVEDDAVQDVFRRGWSTKSPGKPSGRGLGLALVAQAADRNGGRVEVGRDVGAVFTVTFPLLKEVKA